jgi:hypothetical protein
VYHGVPLARVDSLRILRPGQLRKEHEPMAVHTEITPSEAADRLAIRELFDA